MKKGFTLIELLVVVLIIGILAAVALPMYTTSVEKTRLSGYLPLLKAAADSQDRYFLENGTYATAFQDLDIDVFPGCTGQSCIINGKDFLLLNTVAAGDIALYRATTNSYTAITLTLFFNQDGSLAVTNNIKKGTIVCYDRGNAKFTQICKSLGGKDPFTHSIGQGWKIY